MEFRECSEGWGFRPRFSQVPPGSKHLENFEVVEITCTQQINTEILDILSQIKDLFEWWAERSYKGFPLNSLGVPACECSTRALCLLLLVALCPFRSKLCYLLLALFGYSFLALLLAWAE